MYMGFSRVGDKVLGVHIDKPCDDMFEFGAKMKDKNGNQRPYWDRSIKKRLLTVALSTAIAGGAGLGTVQAVIQGISSVSVQPPTSNVGKDATPAFTDDQVNGTGAFSYRYPLSFPAGRHGATPMLSLGYSSEAPLRGGVAAGWSLNVPMITGDTSKGTWTTGGRPAGTTSV